MTRNARIVVLVVSLLAVLVPSAHAVTWHNSGDTAFTASTMLGGLGTISATGVHLACAGYAITGTAGTGPFTGTTCIGHASGYPTIPRLGSPAR